MSAGELGATPIHRARTPSMPHSHGTGSLLQTPFVSDLHSSVSEQVEGVGWPVKEALIFPEFPFPPDGQVEQSLRYIKNPNPSRPTTAWPVCTIDLPLSDDLRDLQQPKGANLESKRLDLRPNSAERTVRACFIEVYGRKDIASP